MHLVASPSEVIVNLPLAETEPWPGLAPVALLTPALGAGLLGAALTGLAGWLGPWLVGATPIAVLFLPLIYVIRRSRPGSVTLVLEELAIRVVHRGRAPVLAAAGLRAAVALDRLSLEGSGQRMELDLQPLDLSEVTELRRVLKELTERGQNSD